MSVLVEARRERLLDSLRQGYRSFMRYLPNMGPLEDQQVLLTVEPSHQSGV